MDRLLVDVYQHVIYLLDKRMHKIYFHFKKHSSFLCIFCIFPAIKILKEDYVTKARKRFFSSMSILIYSTCIYGC